MVCLCLGKCIALGYKALSVQPVTYRLTGNFSKDICKTENNLGLYSTELLNSNFAGLKENFPG